MKKVFALLIACCFASGTLRAQTHWTPQTAQYSGAMGMFCVAEIDGVEQLSDQLELGVFCGDECRATALAQALIIQDSLFHYLFVPTVAGENGHQLTFKLYDHSISQELNLIGPDPITFQENGYGTPIVPFVVSFTSATLLTQTIALTQGVNWISTYLVITMDDLKAALVEAVPGTNISIKSKNNGFTNYNGTKWKGALNTIDLTQMYQVQVASDCEIMLKGLPIDPTEHPITIASGANWIAFPFAENMTLTNAFAGFAISGDNVKSKNDGFANYTNKWKGGLTNLVPGQGYVFTSPSTTPRTFVYPVSSSKAAPKN